MIEIKDNHKCCGCNACAQRCPKSCIVMQEDKEGFLYPVVDKEQCIGCGLCEKVCPVLNQGEERRPLHVYAAKNKNEEIRMQSSSGGIFTLLAEQILEEGGIVFGAGFNKDWEVVHDYTDNKEGLAVFRGSKYVQSRVGETYVQAEQFLKKGRKVLFSGTPCQIAGLKSFLRKEYDNLLTVDFICHGVPSPLVWRNYLNELSGDLMQDISRIEFRNKVLGWRNYSFTLSVFEKHGTKNRVWFSESGSKNFFMRGFLSDLYLRPSCYACPSKCLKSGSDLTLGDFWGIEHVLPEFDDNNKGVSTLFVNTDKHLQFVEMDFKEVEYDDVVKYNSAIRYSAKNSGLRTVFWDKMNEGDLSGLIEKLTKIPLWKMFGRIVKRGIKKIM